MDARRNRKSERFHNCLENWIYSWKLSYKELQSLCVQALLLWAPETSLSCAVNTLHIQAPPLAVWIFQIFLPWPQHVQDLHRIKSGKIPVWVEGACAVPPQHVSYWRLMAAGGRKIKFFRASDKLPTIQHILLYPAHTSRTKYTLYKVFDATSLFP